MDNQNLPRPHLRSDGFPTRSDLLLMTPAEKAIYEVVGMVEEIGAHTLLTDAVVLLAQAREKVADFVELPEVHKHLTIPRKD